MRKLLVMDLASLTPKGRQQPKKLASTLNEVAPYLDLLTPGHRITWTLVNFKLQ